MFRNTVSESLLATLECSENRVPLEPVSQAATPSDGTAAGDEYVVIEPKDITGPHSQSNHTVCFLVQPIRTAMRTCSGTEDDESRPGGGKAQSEAPLCQIPPPSSSRRTDGYDSCASAWQYTSPAWSGRATSGSTLHCPMISTSSTSST
jgi:hypothetical protein